MTQAVPTDEAERAQQLRRELVDQLRADGAITDAAVVAAFLTVPRHVFVPADTPLEDAYAADLAPPTKQDAHGRTLSSVSAPWLQAVMLRQAQVAPGKRVLEVGSGGCNAALIAEIVGRDGEVVSVDIDPEVTDRASRLLDSIGYGGRVRMVQADAEQGVPGLGRFDAALVTVGAWDIPPAWCDQLAPAGVLVVPLVMNGITRSIAFHPRDDHLVSSSAEVCGFVPMQGAGRHPERVVPLTDAHGRQVRLRFDGPPPPASWLEDGLLATEAVEVWSGVTIGHGISFADMYLWFGCFLPGFCKVDADEGTELHPERASTRVWPFGVVRGNGLACLASRPAMDGGGVEFGAHGYGAGGELAATALVEQIRAWDEQARYGAAPSFSFWPNGSDRTRIGEGAAILNKTHGLVAITWPR